MKKIILALILGLTLSISVPIAYAAFNSSQLGSSAANGDILSTNGFQNTWISPSTLSFTESQISDLGAYITDGNTNWDNSYGFITSADDTVSGTELDGVFSTTGLLKRTGAGTYTTVTDTLHDSVTLAGAYDYITLSGQVITRGQIDATTDITGALPIANGGLGAAFTDPNADRLMFWDDSVGAITGIGTLSGAAISGTTLTINDVTCTDCLSSTEITGILTGDITDGTILEGDLDVDDSPVDGDILTYDTTGTNFVWETILALVNSITGAVDWGGITSFEIPNGASPTVDALGEIAVDSTSDQFIFFGSAKRVVSGYQYPSFSYSTSSWSGTTTLELGPAIVGEDWSRLSCYTDAGTLKVSIYDGTNRMNLVNASSTVASFALSTNNTFTAGEKRTVQIGSPATSPKRIGCTVQKAITAN